jgi:hypothetical protein
MLFYLDDEIFFKVAFTATAFLVLAPLIVWGSGIDGKGLMCERPNEESPYGTAFRSIFFSGGGVTERVPFVEGDQYTFRYHDKNPYSTNPSFIIWYKSGLD